MPVARRLAPTASGERSGTKSPSGVMGASPCPCPPGCGGCCAGGQGAGPGRRPRPSADGERRLDEPSPGSCPGGMAGSRWYTTGTQWIEVVLRYHATTAMSFSSLTHLEPHTVVDHKLMMKTHKTSWHGCMLMVRMCVGPHSAHPSWDHTHITFALKSSMNSTVKCIGLIALAGRRASPSTRWKQCLRQLLPRQAPKHLKERPSLRGMPMQGRSAPRRQADTG